MDALQLARDAMLMAQLAVAAFSAHGDNAASLVLAGDGRSSAQLSTAEILESDPCLLPELAQLLPRAHGETEVAAFITDGDGSLELRVWPLRAGFRRQKFRGMVPATTLAMVHTHPHGEDPSEQDIHEAERLALPSFVVTHLKVWVIDPETEPRVRSVERVSWRAARAEPLPQQCSPLQMAR